jgi:hypothetical protein
MLRFLRTLVSVPLLASALVLQSAGTPLATLAAVPQNVDVIVSAIPGDFVTVNHFVAFDVAITNGSGSTVAQLSIVDSLSGDAAGTLRGVLITGGNAAGQTSCTTAGGLSCYAGNMANGATMSLRVIYQATSTGTLTVDFVGSSTGTPGGNTDGGNSHGDTFDGTASIDVLSEFDASSAAGQSTQGYIPDAGDTLETSAVNFGSANPLVTEVVIPAAAVGTQGYLASVREGLFPGSSTCPLKKGCFGQASELTVNGGATLDAPITVTFIASNAKAFTPLSQWTILHSATLTSTPIVLPACSGSVVVNCVVSKNYVSGSKIDYIAVLRLDHNGWIRQG